MKKALIQTFSLLLVCLLLVSSAAAATQYEGVEDITIDAKAALLIDMDTGQVLYSQNEDQSNYPASITKIMTALLTIEAVGRGELALGTVVTVPEAALSDITDDSSSANLLAGEQMSVDDLLRCLLISSANDAANVLAIAVCGDIPTFVDRMNARAQELGMNNTHFVNAHGLHDRNHYTTAYDIYLMAKQAMTHETFRQIVSSGEYLVPATNLSEARALYNTNGLLARYKYPGYVYSPTIGIKTGTTDQAGHCLVAAAKKDGRTLLSVVLGCENPVNGSVTKRIQFIESKRLFEWGFTNFTAETLLDSASVKQEVPVQFSWDYSYILVQPTESVTVLIPGAYDPEKLEITYDLAEKVLAPVAVGDVLGTATVRYAGMEYGTIDLAAITNVPLSPFLAFIKSVNAILGNLFVRMVLLAALLLFIIGMVRRMRDERRKQLKRLEKERRIRLKEERRAQRLAKIQWDEFPSAPPPKNARRTPSKKSAPEARRNPPRSTPPSRPRKHPNSTTGRPSASSAPDPRRPSRQRAPYDYIQEESSQDSRKSPDSPPNGPVKTPSDQPKPPFVP